MKTDTTLPLWEKQDQNKHERVQKHPLIVIKNLSTDRNENKIEPRRKKTQNVIMSQNQNSIIIKYTLNKVHTAQKFLLKV